MNNKPYYTLFVATLLLLLLAACGGEPGTVEVTVTPAEQQTVKVTVTPQPTTQPVVTVVVNAQGTPMPLANLVEDESYTIDYGSYEINHHTKEVLFKKTGVWEALDGYTASSNSDDWGCVLFLHENGLWYWDCNPQEIDVVVVDSKPGKRIVAAPAVATMTPVAAAPVVGSQEEGCTAHRLQDAMYRGGNPGYMQESYEMAAEDCSFQDLLPGESFTCKTEYVTCLGIGDVTPGNGVDALEGAVPSSQGKWSGFVVLEGFTVTAPAHALRVFYNLLPGATGVSTNTYTPAQGGAQAPASVATGSGAQGCTTYRLEDALARGGKTALNNEAREMRAEGCKAVRPGKGGYFYCGADQFQCIIVGNYDATIAGIDALNNSTQHSPAAQVILNWGFTAPDDQTWVMYGLIPTE